MARPLQFFFVGLCLSLIQVSVCQVAVPAMGCIHCGFPGTGDCLSRGVVGQSVFQSVQQTCPLGTQLCYTYLKTTAGAASVVRRGCGLVPCSYLGNEGFDSCGEDNLIRPPVPLVNQTRIYRTGTNDRPTNYVLQYCQGHLCNNGVLSDYSVPGFFIFGNGVVPSCYGTALSLIIPLILAILL